MLTAALCCFLAAVLPWWTADLPQPEGGLRVRLWSRAHRFPEDAMKLRKVRVACFLSFVSFICAAVSAPVLLASSIDRRLSLAFAGSWLSGGCVLSAAATLMVAGTAELGSQYRYDASGAICETLGLVAALFSWWLLGKRYVRSALSATPADAEAAKVGRVVVDVRASPR